jgi:hypothetical protein
MLREVSLTRWKAFVATPARRSATSGDVAISPQPFPLSIVRIDGYCVVAIRKITRHARQLPHDFKQCPLGREDCF